MSREDAHTTVGRLASTRVTLVQTKRASGGGSTSRLLQSRLRIFAAILLAAMLVWLVRGLFFAAPGYLMLQAAALFLVGTLAAPLWSSHQYTRIRLRMFETGLVALTVARLGAYSYLVVTDRLAAGTTLLALAEVYNATMALSGLIVIYGVLIPQHLAAHRASSKFDGYGAGSRTRRTSDL